MNVGGYEVLNEVGRGGAGVVLKARAADGKLVAIKVLFQRGQAPTPQTNLESSSRFQREKRMLLTLGLEQGFVPLLGAGEAPQGSYFVMPFLAGGTLRDRLKKGPMDVDDAVDVVREVARAVGRAHAIGIVHRDLKPENVLFTDEGVPLVADLGLAKHFDKQALGASASIEFSKTGEFKGSTGYMAPEQMNDAKAVGPPADVFALGAILYECLTGQGAFEGANLLEVFGKIENATYESARAVRPELSARIDKVIRRCLSKQPGKRYANATELARALDEEVTAPAASGARTVALVLVLAAIFGGGAFVALRSAGPTPPAPPPKTTPPPAPPPPAPPASLPEACRSFARSRRLQLRAAFGEYAWHNGSPTTALVALEDGRILSGSGDRTVRLWDPATGRELRTFVGHVGPILHIAVAEKARRILSVALSGEAKLWDLDSGALLETLDGGKATCAAISPDGALALFGNEDRVLRIVDLATKEVRREFAGHRGVANAAAVRGPILITGGNDKTLRIWPLDASADPTVVEAGQGSLLGLAVDREGKHVATCGTASTIKLWSLPEGTFVRELAGHEDTVRGVAFSPDGSRLLSLGFDRTVRLWDIASGRELHVMRGHNGKVLCGTFSEDGRVAFTGGEDQAVRRWDVESGTALTKEPAAHDAWVRAVAWSPDGKRALSASVDGTAVLWDLEAGRAVRRLAVARTAQAAFAAAFSADGRQGATGAEDGSVKVWDLASGTAVRTIEAHAAEVRMIAFAGDRLLTGGGDNLVKLWDREGRPLTTFAGHEGAITGLAAVGDAGVVTASKDRTVRTWQLATGAPAATLAGHQDEVHALAVLGAGRALSASVDCTLRLWDLDKGALLRTLAGHLAPVHAVTVLGRGPLAVSAAEDGTIKLWDVERSDPLDGVEMSTIGDFVISLAGSPDGRAFLVGTARGMVLVFDVLPE